VQQPDPFECPEPTEHEIYALRALYRGEATDEQQRLALALIVNKFARTHDLLICPGSPEGTGVMNGRAFVGMRILKYINLPVGKIENEHA
jgi:hypothetical protein